MKKSNLFIAIFFLVLLTRAISHYFFKTGYFDQFFFDNPLWNTARGQFFHVSIPDVNGQNLLGGHFTPILLLFSLPYLITPSPLWMFAIQAAFVAGLAVVIYRFAEVNLEKSERNLVLVLLLTSVTFRSMWFNDFHPDIILSFLTAWALYTLLAKNRPGQAALIILSGFLVKEVAGFIITGFGLYYLMFRKEKALGGLMLIVGIAGTALISQEIIPRFNNSGTFIFSSYYSHFGKTIYEQILNIIIHPINTISFLFSPANLGYLGLLFIPLAGLPWLYPRLLMVGSVNLAVNLLSNYRFQKDFTTQYSYVILPVIFFALVLAIKSLKEKGVWPRVWKFSRPIIYFFIGLSLISFLLLNLRFYIPSPQYPTAHKIIRLIPPAAAVSASDHLLVHLQYRDHLYRFPEVANAELVLFEDIDWWYFNEPGDDVAKVKKLWAQKNYGRIMRLIFLGEGLPDRDYAHAIQTFRQNTNFRLITAESGIFLYGRQ